ncbi:MAG: endonuclease/exonuclease/phosphatase family protein [Paracoccaceae bacterium]
MRVASFNLQNLRLRGTRLDGARDADSPLDTAPGAARLDRADRRLTASVLRDARADVVALQEVFDRAALDAFHDRMLVPAGTAPYPHRVCLPGNDGRGLDVALMSRRPLHGIRSHAALIARDLGLTPPPEQDPDAPIFRRDCLQARAGGLTLFVCHFKAPYPDPKAAAAIRRMEAQAVRALISRMFPDPAAALWLVLGDLNEPVDTDPPAIAPLLPPFSVDLMARLPDERRWSWFEPQGGLYGQPDVLLASPALAARVPGARPEILREGLGLEARRNTGPHLPEVGRHRPHASDHAAIVVEFPGL